MEILLTILYLEKQLKIDKRWQLWCCGKDKGIYYDGESHYFIDGGTEKSGYVPVLMYDAKKKKLYEVIDYGDKEL